MTTPTISTDSAKTYLLALIAILLLVGGSTAYYFYYASRYSRHEQNREVSFTKTEISEDDTIYEDFG